MSEGPGASGHIAGPSPASDGVRVGLHRSTGIPTAYWVSLMLGPLLVACAGEHTGAPEPDYADVDWMHYGGTPHGATYAPAAEINQQNVANLQLAWSTRTGDLERLEGLPFRFETTPLVVEGLLYVSTPTGRVLALRPSTGASVWQFDPEVDLARPGVEGWTTRGVAAWVPAAGDSAVGCTPRIFAPTPLGEIFALDGETGELCMDFGSQGRIALADFTPVGQQNVPPYEIEAITSPPLILNDRLIVGSTVNKTTRFPTAHGAVRAFDVRSGSKLWSFEPLRHGMTSSSSAPSDPGASGGGEGRRS